MQRKQYKNMLSAYSFTELPNSNGRNLYAFHSQTKTNRSARLAVSRFVGDGKEDERALLSFPYWTNSKDKNELSPKPSNWNDVTHLGLALTWKFWNGGADKSQQVFDFELKEKN